MSNPMFTPGEWFAVEYAGYWSIQPEDGYSESDLLNVEKTPEAEANAKLMAASKELFEAAMDFVNKVETGRARSTDSYAKFKSAIQKATL